MASCDDSLRNKVFPLAMEVEVVNLNLKLPYLKALPRRSTDKRILVAGFEMQCFGL